MASTNKTAHLALNQWTLDDPFLMEDFNADNRKLDAEVQGIKGQISAMPYVKLFDVTTKTEVQQVDLDVSGIDLSQFVKLEIMASFSLPRSYNNNYPQCVECKLNKGAVSFMPSSTNTNVTSRDSMFYCIATDENATKTSCMHLEISSFFSNAANKYGELFTRGFGRRSNSDPEWQFCFGCAPKINSINFSSQTDAIRAGARILVYGVRI